MKHFPNTLCGGLHAFHGGLHAFHGGLHAFCSGLHANLKRGLILLYIVGTAALGVSAQSHNHNFETAKQLEIFNTLYRALDLYSVDTLDAGHLVESAIEAMLDEIDPYTEYYKESDTEDLRTLTTGKYAGIGSPIMWRKDCDRCVFHNPYKGMPADKAGVRSGDIIMKIDGKDVGVCGSQVKNDYTTAITHQLRGEPATTFTLTVKRPGHDGLINMKVTRDNIKRPSIVYSGMLDTSKTNGAKVGYILIESFTEDTSADFQTAFKALKADGAESLVIDLRGNGGGSTGDLQPFIASLTQGRNVVGYTRVKDGFGRLDYSPWSEYQIPAPSNHILKEKPIVVLADINSVSCAELATMLIKNLPNGTFIGERTYGAIGALLPQSHRSHDVFYSGCMGDYDLFEYGPDAFLYKDLFPFYVYTSTFHMVDAQYRDVEGVGVQPDYEIKYNQERLIVDHKDLQLENAIYFIKNGRIIGG